MSDATFTFYFFYSDSDRTCALAPQRRALLYHTITRRHLPCDEYFHLRVEYCPSAIYTLRVCLRSVLLTTYSFIHILITPYL